MTTDKVTRPEPPSRRPAWRVIGAFVLGIGGAVSGFVFGMPGKGEFVPLIWLAAFVALLIAPGWPGFFALIVGAAVSAAALDLSDGSSGLLLLVVAIVSALAAHGALSSAAVVRLRTLGWRMGLRDAPLVAAGVVSLGGALIFVWFAGEFARNPP